MVVGEEVNETDVVVIGGGPGGYTAAIAAARAGARTVLIERYERLGGVCLHVGCIPSKALIHVGDIAALQHDGASIGIHAKINVDMHAVQAHVEQVVTTLSRGVASQVKSAGVEVIQGTARFVGAHRVGVNLDGRTTYLEFRKAIIATGSRPVEIPALPFDGVQVVDSTAALRIRELPRRLAVVGGGYIGLELATLFAKLGVAVTVIEAMPSLLAAFDQALVRAVVNRLNRLGVVTHVNTTVTGRTATGVSVRRDGADEEIAADLILVAVGRRPNTDELDLASAGVAAMRSGHIEVDDQLRASATTFAIGDVTPGPPLAHRASAQAEVAGAVAAGRRGRFDPTCIPSVVYTDPEIVSVGLTLAEAKEQGIAANRSTLPLSASGRALTLARPDGRVEVVFDTADGTVVGVHIAGVGVSELSAQAALAIEMQSTLDDIALTVHAHPTLTEVIRDAAMAGLRLADS